MDEVADEAADEAADKAVVEGADATTLATTGLAVVRLPRPLQESRGPGAIGAYPPSSP